MRFLIFVIGVFGGILLIIYHRKLADLIGYKIGWAEKFLGGGGTYLAYVLFGVLAILIGLLIGFGTIDLGWFRT